MIELNNLSCGYDGTDVVHNISITLHDNEKLCIVGPNGCGKTTLLKSMIGLISHSGSITIDEKPLRSYTHKQLAKKIALLTQSSTVHFPYTVFDTVALGRYAHMKSAFGKLDAFDIEFVEQAIKNVDLYDKKDTLISELSGGQLQRVYLARTIAQDPNIILLDEPTNHLDLRSQLELFDFLELWVQKPNRTVVGVLHDLNSVQNFADKVLLLKNGDNIAFGKTKDVLSENNLIEAYQTNVKQYLLNSLEKWKDT